MERTDCKLKIIWQFQSRQLLLYEIEKIREIQSIKNYNIHNNKKLPKS